MRETEHIARVVYLYTELRERGEVKESVDSTDVYHLAKAITEQWSDWKRYDLSDADSFETFALKRLRVHFTKTDEWLLFENIVRPADDRGIVLSIKLSFPALDDVCHYGFFYVEDLVNGHVVVGEFPELQFNLEESGRYLRRKIDELSSEEWLVGTTFDIVTSRESI